MIRVLSGPNNFALKQALREAKDKFVKEYGELALEVIDAEETGFDRILEAVESVPFLAEKKMVVAYNLGLLKEAAERMEEIVKDSGSTELIIVEPKLDRRSSYFKYLKKNTELTEFKELDERDLAGWLVNTAQSKGARLGIAEANYLAQRTGSSQQKAYNELIKLIDYDKDINRQNIDKLTEASPQTSVFNLLDSAFAGNIRKAMDIYDEQRTQGEEPIKILSMLVWQMHLVALVDSAAGRTDAEIMQTSGLKPFTLNKSRSIARRMGKDRIKKVLAELVELDRQLNRRP